MPELFLIRHGIAEEGAPGQPDSSRALTEDGRRRLAQIARGLAALGIQFDELVHSPLLRAVESAEVLAELCRGSSRVDPGLAAPARPELLARLQGPRAALVGHEPFLGELLGLLLTKHPSGHPFDFKKGGTAWLEGEYAAGSMRLVAFLPPRVTRRVR